MPQGESLFGVFDGHGGREVALFCRREIVSTLVQQESYRQKDYEKALKDCFIGLDDKLRTEEGKSTIVKLAREIIEGEKKKGNGEFAGGTVSDEKLKELV